MFFSTLSTNLMNRTNLLLPSYLHQKLYDGRIQLHFEMVEASLIRPKDNSQSVQYIVDGDTMYKNSEYLQYVVDETLLRQSSTDYFPLMEQVTLTELKDLPIGQ